MRFVGIAALVMLAAGCGPREETQLNTAQLNRIAIQHEEVADSGSTARLQPLGAFAAPADYRGPICRFTRGADLLVVAYGNTAAVRVGGVLRTFRAQAMIGPSGGFYRADELALSIGVEPNRPARARMTNRLTEAREEAEGIWECRR